MKNIFKLFLKVCLVILLLHTVLNAQQFASLNNSRIYQGARLAALSGSFIADDFDPGIMYFNPAGLTYLKKNNITLNHFQEKSINAFGEGIILPIKLGKNEGLAFSLNSLHTGYVKKNQLSQLKFFQFAYNVAYSREIINSLSLGAIFGFQFTKSNYNSLWTYRTTFGVSYVPTEEISYSLIVGEMGTGVKYFLSDTETILRRIYLSNGLQVGITMRHPISLIENLYSISLSSEKLFGEKGVRYKAGLELNPIKYLALRSGYFVSDELRYATFGIGIQVLKFVLDLAYYPNKVSNREFYITLSYNL